MKPSRIALAVGSGLLGLSAQAATITVTTTEDGSISGECTLRDAIRSANANQPYQDCTAGEPGHDEIVFDTDVEGVIELSEYEAEGRFIQISESVTITGPGSGQLTIDALNQQQIFTIDAEAPTTISGLTLTGGVGGLPDPDSQFSILTGRFGSAINSYSDVELHDLLVTENQCIGYAGLLQAECLGGAIRVDGDAQISDSIISANTVLAGSGAGIRIEGQLDLANSTISDNYSAGNDFPGGGIYAIGDVYITASYLLDNQTNGVNSFGGGIAVVGTLEAAESTISGNRTYGDGANGGGIWVSGNLDMIESEISYNATNGAFAMGGGLRVTEDTTFLYRTGIHNNATYGEISPGGGISVTGTLFLERATVDNNRTYAESSPGGGVRVSGSAEIITSVVSSNFTAEADSPGGGIYHIGEGSLSMLRSTISHNATTAADSPGGGVYARTDTFLTNSTVSGNISLGQDSPGGGIFVTDAPIESYHASLVNNRAADGADSVYAQEFMLAGNTLIANDHANSEACNKYLYAGSTNNLVTDDSCGTAGLVGESPVSFSSLELDPLANNGGFTLTHAMPPFSIAVNAADTDVCTSEEVDSVDQRGQPRPGHPGDPCDVGAFEVQPLPDEIFVDRFD
jgi:hypothetical protein